MLEHQDISRESLNEIRQLKLKAFQQAFEFHYQNCPEYNRYCNLYDLKPSDIKEYADLGKIQPIPSDVFREAEKLILSVPEKDVISVLTSSSTTSKKPVRFAMDKITFDRMLKVNAKTWVTGHELKIGSLLFLAPKPSQSDTGLVKGGYLTFKRVGFNEEDIYFGVQDNKVDEEGILKFIEGAKKPVHMYGPPFVYLAVVEYLKKINKKLKLGKESRLIMTGGWKTVKHDISKEDLMGILSDYLGVPTSSIRDGYGSTDILTMLPECEYHHKHVPPWFHVSVRDPEDTSREVPNGEIGLTVLMSNYIQSYPAFVMPGDLGAVIERKCECGRNGQIVEIKGRAQGAGARGCAIRIEEFMEIITKK